MPKDGFIVSEGDSVGCDLFALQQHIASHFQGFTAEQSGGCDRISKDLKYV